MIASPLCRTPVHPVALTHTGPSAHAMPPVCRQWSPHPAVILTLTDAPPDITVALRFKTSVFLLDVTRRPGHFWIQDLMGQPWHREPDVARGNGVGTALMNVLLQYLQYLQTLDEERRELGGELFAPPEEAPQRQVQRRHFFNRFGFAIPDDRTQFCQRVDALRPVEHGRPLLGQFPSYVPLAELSACDEEVGPA